MAVEIDSNFDGGRILVIEAGKAETVRLEIPKDNNSQYFQWFYFRASGVKGRVCRFALENAGLSAYPNGWPGYRVAASYDRETWFRIDTHYRDGRLEFGLEPKSDVVFFAYFAPFSLERNADMIARTAAAAALLTGGGFRHETLGRTLDGRALDKLTWKAAGSEKRPQIWVIARQHPGETMASFWMEGFLARLFDRAESLAQALRGAADFHIVPLMNPDGAFRGHLRTNAAGVDLNRQWAAPDAGRSPEVLAVREAMDATGLDLFLDAHGDEALPYNFIAGAEGVPGFDATDKAALERFKTALTRACPDFQTAHGYQIDAPGTANLAIAANQIAHRFKALSMTLEMPFKDNADRPDPDFGFSPARARILGRAGLDAIADWLASRPSTAESGPTS